MNFMTKCVNLARTVGEMEASGDTSMSFSSSFLLILYEGNVVALLAGILDRPTASRSRRYWSQGV